MFRVVQRTVEEHQQARRSPRLLGRSKITRGGGEELRSQRGQCVRTTSWVGERPGRPSSDLL